MGQEISAKLLLDPAIIEDPQPFYRELHSKAPVWKVGETPVYVVSSFELLAEAANRVQDFSSNMICLLYRDDQGLPARLPFGDTFPQTLATADPPLHTMHKRTVFPEFVAKRMALLEPEITELASDCIGRTIGGGSVDFMTEVGNMVPITVISRLIGFRNSDLLRLLRVAFDSTEILASTQTLQELHALMARSDNIQSWIADELEVAAKEPGEDILSSISNGVKSGALSTHDGIIIMQTLLGAGGESTTSLLGNAVRLLAEDQELQQRLRQQPELLPNFVEEALRLEPPFRHHMRSVPKDTSLGGVDIPAGSTLLMFWGAANRDASVFEKPDEVVLERPRRHVGFGRGIHQCVGAPLARLEARVVLKVLLERSGNITLDPDTPPRWVNSLLVRRHEQLHVRVTAP